MGLHKTAVECLYNLVSLGSATDRKSATVNHQSCTEGTIRNSKGLGKCCGSFWRLLAGMLWVHKVRFLAGGCSGKLRANKQKACTTEYSTLPIGAVCKVNWLPNSLGLYTTIAKEIILHALFYTSGFSPSLTPHYKMQWQWSDEVVFKRSVGPLL